MTSPRLAIIAPFQKWGGIEDSIVTLVNEFIYNQLTIELYLVRNGVIPYPERISKHVKIIDLKTKNKLHTTIKLFKLLIHDPPDFILAAKDHAIKSSLLSKALTNSSVPVYIQINNTISQTLRRKFKMWSAKHIYSLADGVITVSHGVSNDLQDYFRISSNRITTIYNPVITKDFPHRTSKAVNHSWFNDKSQPLIMGIGRLTAQKDFKTLIMAFARLRKRRKAKLIILGEGPMRQELNYYAKQHNVYEDLDLPGFVSDPLPWLSQASLFVLSSKYEGLGNVLIEALAVGVPVVATDCPSGPREILEDGLWGSLVPVGDFKTLASSMEKNLNNPPQFSGLEERLLRFHSNSVAQQYLKFMGIIHQ